MTLKNKCPKELCLENQISESMLKPSLLPLRDYMIHRKCILLWILQQYQLISCASFYWLLHYPAAPNLPDYQQGLRQHERLHSSITHWWNWRCLITEAFPVMRSFHPFSVSFWTKVQMQTVFWEHKENNLAEQWRPCTSIQFWRDLSGVLHRPLCLKDDWATEIRRMPSFFLPLSPLLPIWFILRILQSHWFSLLYKYLLGWETLQVLRRATKATLFGTNNSKGGSTELQAEICLVLSSGLAYYPQSNSKSTTKHGNGPWRFSEPSLPGQRVTLCPLIAVFFFPTAPEAIRLARVTLVPYWLCLPSTTTFASRHNWKKLKLSRFPNFERKFSALNVHGKHFHGHAIMALVFTAKRQQNVSTNIYFQDNNWKHFQSRYSVCWLLN